MRIKDMITQDDCNWYFNKFSPLLLLETYMDSKWEFEFLTLGFQGLKFFTPFSQKVDTPESFIFHFNTNLIK